MIPEYGVYIKGDILPSTKLVIRQRIIDLAPPVVRGRLLDIGCGRGLIGIGFAKSHPHVRVDAIDIWSDADILDNSADWVAENARREGLQNGIQARYGDARAVPFPRGAFDVVVSNLVIHDMPPDQQMTCYMEMHRVLRCCGMVLYSDLDFDGRFDRLEVLFASMGFVELRLEHVLTVARGGVDLQLRALIGRKADKYL